MSVCRQVCIFHTNYRWAKQAAKVVTRRFLLKHCLPLCDQLHQATARNLLQPFPNQLGSTDIFQAVTNDTAELYFFDINASFVEVDDMALQLWSRWRSCCTLKEDRPTISYVITPPVWVPVQTLIIFNCLIKVEKYSDLVNVLINESNMLNYKEEST